MNSNPQIWSAWQIGRYFFIVVLRRTSEESVSTVLYLTQGRCSIIVSCSVKSIGYAVPQSGWTGPAQSKSISQGNSITSQGYKILIALFFHGFQGSLYPYPIMTKNSFLECGRMGNHMQRFQLDNLSLGINIIFLRVIWISPVLSKAPGPLFTCHLTMELGRSEHTSVR